MLAGARVPQAATPPPTPRWTAPPPPLAELPREITGSHMKGNFSQAETKLKAASHHPRLPLLCQARPLSSWRSKGACDTREGVGGQNPHPTWLLPFLPGTMAETFPPPDRPLSFRSCPFVIPKALTHLKPGPNMVRKSFLKSSFISARLRAAGWGERLLLKWMRGRILHTSSLCDVQGWGVQLPPLPAQVALA